MSVYYCLFATTATTAAPAAATTAAPAVAAPLGNYVVMFYIYFHTTKQLGS